MDKTKNLVQSVILAGGTGSRLWPLSRAEFPKQFLPLFGEKTLFQQAIIRGKDATENCPEPIIIASEDYRFIIKNQLDELKIQKYQIILEPEAKNTAPAITLSALLSQPHHPEKILIVSPSDHIIKDEKSFTKSVKKAIGHAKNGAFVVFGIKPNSPHTGYGYIKRNKDAVEDFIEKPSIEKAKLYLQENNFYWNSGIFVFKASLWIKFLKSFSSELYNLTESAWLDRAEDGHFLRPDKNKFKLIPNISADYAVFEKLPSSPFDVKIVELETEWSDLGSWKSIHSSSAKDDNNNSFVGDVLCLQSENNYVNASNRLVGLIDVNNLAVIETSDAVLVTPLDKSENVKTFVEHLNKNNRQEIKFNKKVYRPWGWYDCLEEGEKFKVKRINVKPGAKLSLQKHKFRAEHWVVIKGYGEVVCGDKTFILEKNASTFIPLGAVHRLSNPGDEDLEIIEVQSGDYLGEDDIIRIEDEYGR